MSKKQDEYISIKEAAKIANYTDEHMRRLMRNSDVEGKFIIAVWTVNKASLKAYLKSQKARHKTKLTV